ncbi:MFS transporter [Singulisphaera sp. PoT]|uniref:MFS transporter n=1 Tax=Singulisphaera sp. PoT TaxID=3411797 RepID=UPI003BF54C0C
MATNLTESLALPGVREQIATRLTFFVAGFAYAAWAPIVPYVKRAAGLDDGQLGMLLLCLGMGSMIAMPLAGAAASRLGCRFVILTATALVGLALPILAGSTMVPALVVALTVFGGGIGAMDCAMNIQAINVERASGRTMMSGFHGLFSVGGLLGSAAVTFLLWAGVLPLLAVLGVVAIIAVLMGLGAAGLLPYGSQRAGESSWFAIPHGVVLFLGILCFIVFLAEGSILDWSAEFLTKNRKFALAGFGYAAFSLTMAAGRLTGDAIVARIGPVRTVGFGGSIAAAGFALAMVVPTWQAAIIGFALVGVGCSNVVPVLFSSVGRQTTMPEHLAVPAITIVGYAGILAGPAMIGFLAQAVSLPFAFAVVAILLVGVAFSGRFLPAQEVSDR